MLTAPGLLPVDQGRLDGNGGIQPGHQISDGHPGLLWPTAGQVIALTGDAHQPAEALDNEIVTWLGGTRPSLAEAGDRTVHQARIELCQGGVIQPVFLERARLVVLDQHIAICDQSPYQLLPLGTGQVDRDRPLAPVGRLVVGGLGGPFAVAILHPRRPPATGIIAAARPLDLDHLSSKISQNLTAPWSSQHPAQIQHPYSRQRTHSVLPLP